LAAQRIVYTQAIAFSDSKEFKNRFWDYENHVSETILPGC